MFFIYGTDAPIYHYPIITGLMVAINVLIHVIATATGYDVTPWILSFGDGLHPVQWVTHNFLHIGWLHLIGNMIFLIPFGLIVEGKIGWFRMLVLYMAIGTLQGFSQQVIMLPSDPADDAEALVELFNDPNNPMDEETKEELTQQWRQDLMKEGFGSLGASAVIFGLLAVCAIWAPANEFDVYFRWSLFVSAPDGGEREWSVLTVCGIFIAKELGMFVLMGMSISSEALHLNGFVIGGIVGLTTLYFGFVDCEGFDLLSMWSGTPFKATRIEQQERRERQAAIDAAKPQGPPQAIVPKMPHQMQSPGQVVTAYRPPRPIPPQPASPHPASPQPASPQSTPQSTPLAHVSPSMNSPRAMPQPIQPVTPLLADPSLPDFDDGVVSVDPNVEARSKIEAMIARGLFSDAVRLLAETRKHDHQFVVSAASMGRLAEGLIKANHLKPAVTVLSIGCDAYPAYEPRWRIRIASLELSVNSDAIAAIKQLKMIDKEALDSTLRTQYLKVAQHAKRMAGR